ncbi:LysR substrate-binding domain-containing protein [Actinomadura luteofluorescens]|uniref:LysR family transcriptional regulator substrate-binding protein n=1 Tax=Actinomadura luteofluorescens TaxID=46163 RepID=UPI002164256E|nr:LysR family transcriptional regulator substrate-binding protein [Actinomadura glauciflava]MCR3745828.1 LysR substrate binding domain-containing protein [Actinomadura glauciflava]
MTEGEFRLAYVPGVTPAKWAGVWAERVRDVPLRLVQVPAADIVPLLRKGDVDAAFVRLPVDREALHVIPLYLETTVVVVPKDHAVAAAEEVELADLADEDVFEPLDEVLTWDERPGQPAFTRPEHTAEAIELVASGTGTLLLPQSLARLHHRRDLTYRTVTDAPQSQIGLAWLEVVTTDLMEELIGIVRGRTPNSSRGRNAQQQPARKKPPRQRSTPKQPRRQKRRRT